jgi:hypothetical protein
MRQGSPQKSSFASYPHYTAYGGGRTGSYSDGSNMGVPAGDMSTTSATSADDMNNQFFLPSQWAPRRCNFSRLAAMSVAVPNPEERFLREPSLTQLQNWVTTYEPMIRARARIQHQLNQQGLMAIDVAFEHANSLTLGPSDPSLTNTDVRTFVSHWVLS